MSARLRPIAAHLESRREGTLVLNRDLGADELPGVRRTDTGEPLTPVPAAPDPTLTGYTRRGDAVVFGFPAATAALTPGEIRVAGDFNGWAPDARWALRAGDDPALLELAVPLRAVIRDGAATAAFKFVTGHGVWIQPEECAPNRVRDAYGNANLLFHPLRSGRHLLRFRLREAADADRPLTLTVTTADGEYTLTVACADAFLGLTPRGRLGAIVEADGTRFRVFAPRAASLAVETRPPDGGPARRLELAPGRDGVWETLMPENLDGHRYVYFASGDNHDSTTAFAPEEPILDPYARAAEGPAGPGIILADRRFPKPERPFTPPAVTDLVIAELHLADTLGLAGAPGARPTYRALAEFIRRPDCPLRDRGFNAVELLPLQEFDAPHPAALPPGYHWGYMPVNWFSPTSLYASDPHRATQVDELRDLVAAFHEAGLAVILDVVYNHTGEPNALLRLDKHHFFTFAPDGSLTNHSGCGNDLRADTPAAVKLITDSLRHWVEAYDVDGFRFDLAELIGAPTLETIRAELAPVKPGLIFIAEPWSFRGHIGGALRGSGYASWNDGLRDTLAHYVWGARTAAQLAPFLTGAHAAPADTVNYTESHDDFCWIDRITENPRNDGTAPTANDLARTRLMAATLMVAPGAVMLCGGQEFARTKSGHHNTYIRGDLSRLTPARAAAFRDLTAYVRGLIALRRSAAGAVLRPATPRGPGFYRTHADATGLALVIEFNAGLRDATGGRALFAINPGKEPVAIPLPAGLAVDDLRLVADGARVVADPAAALPPGTGALLRHGLLRLPPLAASLWLG